MADHLAAAPFTLDRARWDLDHTAAALDLAATARSGVATLGTVQNALTPAQRWPVELPL